MDSAEDNTFPTKSRQAAEAIFAARKGKEDFVDYEFVDYKGITLVSEA
jgi:carboxymethylenebutenolidase